MKTLPSLREVIRKTTLIHATRIGNPLGIDLILASETFQHTGSFKFRAAYNVALNVPQNHLIAASSGNFGQALAYACSLLKKSCTIVMPSTSARVKVDAVKEYGGQVEFVDTRIKTRHARVQELSMEFPEAYVASAYDDPWVIEGNATLGEELCESGYNFDAILVPIGGGGLSSGIITAIRQSGKNIEVIGTEPEIANDASRSLQKRELVANEIEPQTIADGVKSLSLGKHNWAILKDNLSKIIEVSEETIKKTVGLLFLKENLKVEPTGALSLAALLRNPESFQGRSICCVITGGNVNPKTYVNILSQCAF